MTREITIDSVLLMSRIQEIHNRIVHIIGKRIDALEAERTAVSSGDIPDFDRGFNACIESVRTVLSQVELEPWQMEVQLRMLEVSLGE